MTADIILRDTRLDSVNNRSAEDLKKIYDKGLLYKGFKIVLNKLWQAQEGPNEIHTYINGYKVTIRFYVENGWILSMDMFMGWATRVIGKLLK